MRANPTPNVSDRWHLAARLASDNLSWLVLTITYRYCIRSPDTACVTPTQRYVSEKRKLPGHTKC